MEDGTRGYECRTSFISANSAEGFFSLYDEVFDPLKFDKIFVIAGGPGTGKSTLLRKVAEFALAAGADTEQILCSSDPGSLDGVIMQANGKRVGIFDGTPPHARTITAPGYTEELCNLGTYWDDKKLLAKKKILLETAKAKKAAYASAYCVLHALGALRKEGHLALKELFEEEKAARQIRHKTHLLKQKGASEKRFLRAYSALGEFILPFEKDALQNVLLISGKEESAEIYLSFFDDYLTKKEIAHTAYLSALCPLYTEAIYLPENKTLLIKERLYRGTVKARRIVSERFFRPHPQEEKEKTLACEQLKALLLSHFKRAGELHMQMEAIYKEAMDFGDVGKECTEICEKVLHSLLLTRS